MTYALSTPIRGPEAWLGSELAACREWIRPFAARAVDEIDAALRGVQRRGLAWPKFGREDFVTYHGRTHYEDADGADQDRLLLRLWLATPNRRALPSSYLPIWGTTAPGAPRGGIAPAASA